MARRPSLQTLHVLHVLLDSPGHENYGSAIAEATDLRPGSVYTILKRVEARGWAVSRLEDVNAAEVGRPRKVLYTLTDEGAGAAREALTSMRRWLALPGEPIDDTVA